jgi:hypothetical protein
LVVGRPVLLEAWASIIIIDRSIASGDAVVPSIASGVERLASIKRGNRSEASDSVWWLVRGVVMVDVGGCWVIVSLTIIVSWNISVVTIACV